MRWQNAILRCSAARPSRNQKQCLDYDYDYEDDDEDEKIRSVCEDFGRY
jgi:hypothetical protein